MMEDFSNFVDILGTAYLQGLLALLLLAALTFKPANLRKYRAGETDTLELCSIWLLGYDFKYFAMRRKPGVNKAYLMTTDALRDFLAGRTHQLVFQEHWYLWFDLKCALYRRNPRQEANASAG